MPVRRKAIIAASMLGAVGIGGVVGAIAWAPTVSGAASSTTQAPSSTGNTTMPPSRGDTNMPPGNGYGMPPSNFDPTQGGHTANGITEELLTGDTATRVRDAALAAVPGGTVQRVETDAEGAKYEAHMTKSDGTEVTVKVDANFDVSSIEDGPR